jgi:glycosyltransferase involved in cell wall biosynthesis
MRKKRIVIDARMIGAVGHGIGNYVLDLAAALQEMDLPWEFFYLVAPGCQHPLLLSLPHQESKLPFLHRLEPWLLAKELRALEPSLFHTPSFASLSNYPCPHIQTIHDLIHLSYGGLFQRLYYRTLVKPSLRRAVEVHTVSESARAELAAWAGTDLPYRVVTNAVVPSPAGDRRLLAKFGLEKEEYFFCLSNPKAHKNVDMLLGAHAEANARGKSLPLVVNVPGPKLAGVVRISSPTSEEIAALYAFARAYYFPSLVEGFGRSPLEAALQGTRPVVSAIPAHEELFRFPEVAFLNPRDPNLWTENMLRLSREPKAVVSPSSQQWIAQTYSLAKLGEAVAASYRLALAAR